MNFISYFSCVKKTIVFIYNGVAFPIARLQTGIKPDTITKIAEGLNHFLYYYYLKADGSYEELTEELFNYFLKTKNRFQQVRDDINNNSSKEMMLAIEEVGKLIPLFIDRAAEYAYNIQIPNIDESKATTDVTLTNNTALLLAAISVVMKLSFIFVNNANIRLKWIDTITYYDEYLVSELTDRLVEIDPSISPNIDDELLSFLYDRVANLWSSSPESYKEKFASIGLDVSTHGSKNKIDIYNALKKYVPQVITYEIGRDIYECVSEKELKDLYWTEGKDFNHFKFVSQNMAAYIQRTLGDINSMQDQNKSVTDVNVAEVLMETAGEDASSRREESLYEDKQKYLYELRKKTVVDLFKVFIEEFNRSYPNYYNVIKMMNINKENSFNQYILGIILLSMTGECFVYRDVLGVYGKVFLALFYLRAKESPILQPISDKLEIMHAEKQSVNTHFPEDKIIEHLEKIGRTDLLNKVQTIGEVCTTYHTSNQMIELSPSLFIEILDLFKNPSRVRNLLFPNKYKILTDKDNETSFKHNPYVQDIRNYVLVRTGNGEIL